MGPPRPPYDPLPYTSKPDAAGGFTSVGGDGRIAGTELAACLAGALLVLAAGTAFLQWLISRRRELEELITEDDQVLRTLAMKRLLRTAATVAAGLAAIAGNFACRPDPSSTTAWTNAAAVGAIAVLLVMWWWPPPRLPSLRSLPRTRHRERSPHRWPQRRNTGRLPSSPGPSCARPAWSSPCFRYGNWPAAPRHLPLPFRRSPSGEGPGPVSGGCLRGEGTIT